MGPSFPWSLRWNGKMFLQASYEKMEKKRRKTEKVNLLNQARKLDNDIEQLWAISLPLI